MSKSLVAAIQMASSPNLSSNLMETARLVAAAAQAGARLAVLPENFALMGYEETDKFAIAEEDGVGQIQETLSKLSSQHKIWLVGGTMPIRASSGKVRAASLIFDNKGNRVARYDKIHLFDVCVPETEESYQESSTIEPGDQACVVDTPVGRLGLSVCYDIRFPELYRKMMTLGMDLFAVPSAFTAKTGAAHWEVLVRSRAIENQCYAIAANQGGFHLNGRETFGHTMIVDPWGTVISRLPNGSGVVTAEVSAERIRSVRKAFPALDHVKLLNA